MAYIQDSTQSFTITLTALLEGLGIIDSIEVLNATTNQSGLWVDGTWTTPIPDVTEKDSIQIIVEVINNGATIDTLFAEFNSTQVTPNESLIQETANIVVGGGFGALWTFAMPPNDVNITINAGHIE